MPSHVFLCAYYNNRGYKNGKTRKTEGEMVTETNRNKANQMKKAHIHGLSSHIFCVLINLMANDKNTDVYIQKLKEMIISTYTSVFIIYLLCAI